MNEKEPHPFGIAPLKQEGKPILFSGDLTTGPIEQVVWMELRIGVSENRTDVHRRVDAWIDENMPEKSVVRST